MFIHLLIAALRNIAANKLQSAIAIIGLAIGIAAALLMALVVRNQLTFDHFIPGYERTYMGVSQNSRAGRPDTYTDTTHANVASLIKLNVPEVEDTTRLMQANTPATLKQGQIAADEEIYWADPNAFAVLPLPAFQGDPAKALLQSDGIVLPRSAARKFFGRDNVVGQAILVNGHPMTVRAVIENLPANGTSLKSGIFASDLASFSPPTNFTPPTKTSPAIFPAQVMTYVRLKLGASINSVEQRLPQLLHKSPGTDRAGYTLLLVGLDQLPMLEAFHPRAKNKLAVMATAGVLILLIAAINFVNLLTARAARRSLEVGVRKVCGAARRMLVLQFLGESVLTVFAAACLAVGLSEWQLPAVNAFLESGARLDYWQSPLTLGLMLSGVLLLGLLAGAWPAFVLSSFRPSGVLKGVLQHSRGADLVRNALVVLQFAILIVLVVAAGVIFQQNLYATRDGLRGNIDQMLVMQGGCKPAFRNELRKLPGVAGVACSSTFLNGAGMARVIHKDTDVSMDRDWVDPGWFALYGIKPLAGSLPPATPAGDFNPNAAPGIVLNVAAIKYFGLASPQAAIGQLVMVYLPVMPGGGSPMRGATLTPVVAVVPDFSFQAVADKPILPTTYSPSFLDDGDSTVSIELKGQLIPETLAAIDRAWRATNPGKPIDRFFLNEHMQQLYLSLLREAQLFAIFAGIAVFLACLGLLGLSMSTAERRTKEFGIRKAMGAASGDVTRLLLWQFAKPVLWANLIAWPVAWYAMSRWLSGFAYHVELSPLIFIGATMLAVFVALITVAVSVNARRPCRPGHGAEI